MLVKSKRLYSYFGFCHMHLHLFLCQSRDKILDYSQLKYDSSIVQSDFDLLVEWCRVWQNYEI